MRGEKVTYRATPVVVEVQKVATTSPTAAAASKDFEFATPLDTIEQLEPFATAVKKTDGIIDVSGSERQITVKWDPAKLDEAKVRALLAAAGHGVK